MSGDAFSKCHPAVNLLFFLGAIVFASVIQHPAYLLAGLLGAGAYYLLLRGRQGWKLILGMLPLLLLVTLMNPLFNSYGRRILFRVFGRPYTLEALLYGGAIAAIFAVMLLWFGCYNQVLTGDKLTVLLGNVIPAVSLLLVMVMRMVPNLTRKARQITGARKSLGKGGGDTCRAKLESGLTALGALTSWALEGSVVTGDSMRARGYGTAKRSSFSIYRMRAADWILTALMLALCAAVILAGGTGASFTPELSIAPLNWGFGAYCAYLLIPTALHIKEACAWHISRSKI